MTQPLLTLSNLCVTLPTADGRVPALRGVSLQLQRGQTLGLIGESGCGKSLTALAVMGLLPEGAGVSGSIRLGDTELTGLSEAQWCSLRGRRVGMVFQEPMSALNPLQTVGRQVAEPLRLHRGWSASAAQAEALRLLNRVQLPQAAQRLRAYPHQLSGGQRQRVLIAMALACGPELLIADEPTTALDTTVQREVLALIRQLVVEDGMGLLLISHDLGVMADNVQHLVVMYAGTAVEQGSAAQLLTEPAHPYTRALLAARPRLRQGTERLDRRTTRLATIPGRVLALADIPAGCAYAERCEHAQAACRAAPPPDVQVAPEHSARCVLVSVDAKTTAAAAAVAVAVAAKVVNPLGGGGQLPP